jgi:hypothetical protein
LLKSANLPDGRRAKAVIRLENQGTRTAFSQGFIRDFALVWSEEG